MKRNVFKNLNFIFALCLFSLISVFVLQGNFLADFCSSLDNHIVALADTQKEEVSLAGIDGLTVKYSLDGEEVTSLPATCTYTGSEHTLSIDATATGVTGFRYRWYYSSSGTEFTQLSSTTSSVTVEDVADTGNFYCVLTNIENSSQTEQTDIIRVVVEPKEIVFTSLTPVDKIFDGTNKIELVSTYSGVVDGDDISVTAYGETHSANVDNDKLVTYKNGVISGDSANNYKISTSVPTDYMFVDIAKRDVELVWETAGGKTSFVYNGKNQLSNISPYYISHTGEKIRPNFTITGFNTTFFSLNYAGEFINTGTYEAVVTMTQNESNYNLVDSSGDVKLTLFITRATPEITIENTTFTYNGQTQNANRCVTINNDEQTLTFENNTFITVEEGNGLEVTVKAEQSLNYFALTKKFNIEVLKATATIDISGIRTEYVYTGNEQIINAGAILSNSEQVVVYSNNRFTTVEQGNNLVVTVSALATENYNYVQKTFKINVSKANVNTSNWSWYYPTEFVYTGSLQSVFLTGYDSNIVQPYYIGASFVDAGTYTAKVNLVLVNENYNPVNFDSLIWKINKASVVKPTLENVTSVYNGAEQTLHLQPSPFYTVSNNVKKNAGTYEVSIALKNNANMKWQDGSTENAYITWVIEKAIVEVPNIANQYEYTGKEQSLKINDNNIYTVLNKTGEKTGKYTTYLVLKDASNYRWENTTEATFIFNWEIIDKEAGTAPVIAIVLACFVIVLIAVYATFHSTVVIKRHRRRKAMIKTDSLERAKELSLTSVDEVKPAKRVRKPRVTKEQKKAVKQQKKVVKAEKKQAKQTAKKVAKQTTKKSK